MRLIVLSRRGAHLSHLSYQVMEGGHRDHEWLAHGALNHEVGWPVTAQPATTLERRGGGPRVSGL